MNSYPPELLVQLAPVMFVAGLDPPQSGRTDSFSTLVARLRDALTTQRKVGIWQPERNKTFQVVLVDKVCVIRHYTLIYNYLIYAP
jgi:trafficking protein particle complex subunit 11